MNWIYIYADGLTLNEVMGSRYNQSYFMIMFMVSVNDIV